MQVKEAMSKDFKIISPDTTVKEAAEMMREHECGYLPIGADDKLAGAVTDRDIVIRGIAAGHNPDDTTVDKVMTEKIVYCYEEDDIKTAVEKMKKEQIRRLVVLNKDKRMTGIITVGDIARTSNDNQLIGDLEIGVAQVA